MKREAQKKRLANLLPRAKRETKKVGWSTNYLERSERFRRKDLSPNRPQRGGRLRRRGCKQEISRSISRSLSLIFSRILVEKPPFLASRLAWGNLRIWIFKGFQKINQVIGFKFNYQVFWLVPCVMRYGVFRYWKKSVILRFLKCLMSSRDLTWPHTVFENIIFVISGSCPSICANHKDSSISLKICLGGG